MIGILALAIASASQAPALSPAPVTASTVSAEQAGTTADPARIAAAATLLNVMHIDDQYESLFGRMVPVMTVQIISSMGSNAKLPPHLREYFTTPTTRDNASRVFAEETMRGFRARFADMRKATAHEYALSFTTDELNAIIAFYKSPVGQKALTMLPALQAKLLPIGMKIGAEVGKLAMQHTFARLNLDEKKPIS